MGDVLASYGGFFSGAEDVEKMKNQLYQTSDGFRYNPFGSNRPEAFPVNYRGVNLLNYFWQQKEIYMKKKKIDS